jgi:hypothetical protein
MLHRFAGSYLVIFHTTAPAAGAFFGTAITALFKSFSVFFSETYKRAREAIASAGFRAEARILGESIV